MKHLKWYIQLDELNVPFLFYVRIHLQIHNITKLYLLTIHSKLFYFIYFIGDTVEIFGIIVLLVSGFYFSFKLKFKHLNMIKALKVITRKENGISSFKSLCISLASRIGVGSLSGVVLSIYLGGIGSIFWMWLITLVCSSNTMIESMLSIKYRKDNNDDTFEGGPFYYIESKSKKLSLVYAVIFLLSYTIGFTMIQSNTISIVITEFVPIPSIIIGIILVILTSLIVFKGIKEIASIISKLIPLIALLYISTCLIVIFKNINLIGNLVILIIKEAFNMKSFVVGFVVGCTKSIFSTEAGLGTGAIACASTSNANAKEQGLVQVFGIFFDTFVVSTLTAFVVLLSPKLSVNLTNFNGIEVTRYAFIYHLGKYGGLILTISIILFAFSTIISSYYYGEVALKYITKSENTIILKITTILILLISTIISPMFIWETIDTSIVILAIFNTIFLILLRKDVFDMMKKYDRI